MTAYKRIIETTQAVALSCEAKGREDTVTVRPASGENEYAIEGREADRKFINDLVKRYDGR